MGKKYIIELEDENVLTYAMSERLAINTRLGNAEGYLNTMIPLTPYTEPDLEQVKADAYLKGLKDGQGVTIESQQNNAFNDGYKKCLKDFEQVRKEAYEQGANDQRKQDEAEMMLLGSASVGAYESGLKKAWETALKLVLLPVDGGIGAVDLIEIFGYSSYVDILKTFSVNEVIQKIQQYEDEKREELKFGDEVIAKKGGDSDAKKACVIYPNDGKSQCLVLKDTGTTEWWSKCWIRKTGRNYPEIEEVLKKMRE